MRTLLETLLELQETIPFDLTINNKNKTIVIEYGKPLNENKLG